MPAKFSSQHDHHQCARNPRQHHPDGEEDEPQGSQSPKGNGGDRRCTVWDIDSSGGNGKESDESKGGEGKEKKGRGGSLREKKD